MQFREESLETFCDPTPIYEMSKSSLTKYRENTETVLKRIKNFIDLVDDEEKF